MNERTASIFEVGSMPWLHFDEDLEALRIKRLWYGTAGVRFFFTKWTAVDAGIRYRSNRSGLAETEIRSGVNVGIDVPRELAKRGRK